MKLITLSEKEIIITLIALGLLLLSAFLSGTLFEKIKADKSNIKTISLVFNGATLLPMAGYWLRFRQKKDPEQFNKMA